MNELRRLLEHGATDAERALLRSARADGPGEGSAERMLVALGGLTGIGGGVDAQGSALAASRPGPEAAVAAPSIKLGALAKVALAALVGVGALAGGAFVYHAGEPRPAPSAGPGERAAAAPAVPVPPALANPPAQEALPAGAASDVGIAPARGAGPALHRRPENAVDESLRAEIRLLDAARAAVDARNPAAAERALESYAERFPQGHLKPEAAVLRLAVLVGQGRRAEAKSLAAALLASQSYKAYELRIRSLLREAGP
jgi:hypothetical protein